MNLAVIILAAGLGTRMKSKTPKVLHAVLGKPMIHYVCDTAGKLKPDRMVVVTNPAHDAVRESLAAYGHIDTAVQLEALGTADAVRSALSSIGGFKGTILVINGDTPLVKASTVKRFLSRHGKTKSDLSVLSFRAQDPCSYGRIVRDSSGRPLRIVEKKDLTGGQAEIKEVNSGVYAMNYVVGGLMDKIKINAKKGEYYLTDILDTAQKRGFACKVFNMGEEEEFYGVNTMSDLLAVQRIIQEEVIKGLMRKGVRFYDPDSVIVHPGVGIGPDTIIYPGVCLEGDTVIGGASKIYRGVRIVDSRIGKNVSVLDNSLVESSRIDDNSVVGPCAHLRPKSVLGKGVKIGNFVELKNAEISDGAKAAHLSYIGDASVGKGVNIGAGTITCNYDGFKKHRTVIGENVFVGSDTQFVAPVNIGEGAFIAAGSTITEDVPPYALAISRTKQWAIDDWVKKRKK